MRTNILEINGKSVDIVRVDNCINGNPRFVIHFLSIADNYIDAINIARQIGGKKYRAKWFGGGIVFSSYNVKEDLKRIIK
jgi:hypothetical protein